MRNETWNELVARQQALRDAPKATTTTVTELDAQVAPAQRSTKLHGKSGYWQPNRKHRYFRQVQHQNLIAG